MSRAFLCVVSSWVQHQCGCTDQRPSCGWTRPTKMRPKIFLIKRIVLPETTVMPFAAPSLSYSLWLIDENGEDNAGLRRAILLGRAILPRVRAVWLVPEVQRLGSTPPSIHSSSSPSPRRRMWQLWFYSMIFDTSSFFRSLCISPFFTGFFFFFFMIAAFSEGMVNDGYKEVVNIDISSVVIQAMQRKYSDRPQLKCIFCKFYNCFYYYCYLFVDG